MMQVSQKTQYALRAMFELAQRHGCGPTRIGDIAERQAIPARFLEGILNQLRQAGLLRSVRGSRGGYELALEPAEISVGDMMRIVEGPIAPTECLDEGEGGCPLYGSCAFEPMWRRAAEALAAVYDGTTFADLLEEDKRLRETAPLNYVI
jgi:Rrf2 family cysteine metabolism transcriptional repressor